MLWGTELMVDEETLPTSLKMVRVLKCLHSLAYLLAYPPGISGLTLNSCYHLVLPAGNPLLLGAWAVS